jgi:hypothetical protein
MELVVGVFGGLIVLAAAADMVNTLVTTSTSGHRFRLTHNAASSLLDGEA